MARKNAIISATVTGTVLTFNVEGAAKPIVVDAAKLSDDIRAAAIIHGLTQKIADAAALGKDATPADKAEAMRAVADRLTGEEPSWNKRAGDGSDSAPSGLIFKAFLEFATERATAAKKPIPSEEKVRELYDSKTRSEQLAMRKIPEIAAIIERMKGDKAAKSAPDADALLADILG